MLLHLSPAQARMRRGFGLVYSRLKATTRIQLALERLSRDRWLSPQEVERAAWRFYECAVKEPKKLPRDLPPGVNQQQAVKVGMIRGHPVVGRNDPRWDTLRSRVGWCGRDGGVRAEMVILRVLLGGWVHLGNKRLRSSDMTEILELHEMRRIRKQLVQAIELVCTGQIEVGRAMAVFAGAKAYADNVHAEMTLLRLRQPEVDAGDVLSLGPQSDAACECEASRVVDRVRAVVNGN